jgi:glycosyltransferase involved in cell wall biosynthesis
MTKKILMVNEFSQLATGYSTYGKEVLSRLHAIGKYEIAELATYIDKKDPRIKQVPWKVFPNAPTPNTPEAQGFDPNSPQQFGGWSFENYCLEFQPDIVFAIRDVWMDEHIYRSPYKKCFKFAHMPTVDAIPQQEAWIDMFNDADAVLSYTDWNGNVLINQSGGKIKWRGSASPSASMYLHPMTNRKDARMMLGYGPSAKVIGTVMRNQPRKLYPELFRTFRRYLDKSKSKDTVLYCHTSYPDNGWDIPSLIKEFGLSSKVFLTYVCDNCKFAYPVCYQDAYMFCPRCHMKAAHLVNPQTGVDHSTLNPIYNMMDLYVQYANSEGFGLPMVEAGACGVPVAATDYSAMSDVVRKLEGFPIRVSSYTRDFATGCDRARPSDDSLIEIMTEFFSLPDAARELKRQQTRRAFEKNYSWDTTAQKWAEVFDSLPIGNWKLPPRIHEPAQPNQESAKLNNTEFSRWLIAEVLGEPERIGTYFEARINRDLNHRFHLMGMGGMYFNEEASLFNRPNHQPYDRNIAYNQMRDLCLRRNHLETARAQKLGL